MLWNANLECYGGLGPQHDGSEGVNASSSVLTTLQTQPDQTKPNQTRPVVVLRLIAKIARMTFQTNDSN